MGGEIRPIRGQHCEAVTNQRPPAISAWAGWSSVVPSILILTSELACLGPLCLSSPLQRLPGLKPGRGYLSLSLSLSLSVLYLVPESVSSIIYVELSFVTRLISGWMEEG